MQRFANEIVLALDRLVAQGDVPKAFADAQWTVVTPGTPEQRTELKAIRYRSTPAGPHPHVWDQAVLPWAAAGARLVSLANTGPVLHRRQLAVIHDAIVFRHPEFYSRTYVNTHKTVGRLLARTATVATVSEFSRNELSELLRIDKARMPIIANGADHLSRVVPDESVLGELDLNGRPYFLAIGSLTDNKNVQLAARAFARLNRPDARLVVVGSGSAIFRTADFGRVPGLLRPGRLTDEKVAALYQRAVAFAFPSIYEGFGIPPLEAMAFGCPVMVSTAPALRETCGDYAEYFAPHDIEKLASLMRGKLEAPPPTPLERERLKTYAATFRWDASARKLLEALAAIR